MILNCSSVQILYFTLTLLTRELCYRLTHDNNNDNDRSSSDRFNDAIDNDACYPGTHPAPNDS